MPHAAYRSSSSPTPAGREGVWERRRRAATRRRQLLLGTSTSKNQLLTRKRHEFTPP
jgi:hypothetical protein